MNNSIQEFEKWFTNKPDSEKVILLEYIADKYFTEMLNEGLFTGPTLNKIKKGLYTGPTANVSNNVCRSCGRPY